MEDGRRWETDLDWEIGFPLSVQGGVPWMFRGRADDTSFVSSHRLYQVSNPQQQLRRPLTLPYDSDTPRSLPRYGDILHIDADTDASVAFKGAGGFGEED